MELAFAGLHQLCAPLLDRLERLPGPAARCARHRVRLSAGDAPDRFLVGLAVLSLLSDVAEERPLVCIVDDAQWLDGSPRRRWRSSRAGSSRSGRAGVRGARAERRRELAGLPELVVDGARRGDARRCWTRCSPAAGRAGRATDRRRDARQPTGAARAAAWADAGRAGGRVRAAGGAAAGGGSSRASAAARSRCRPTPGGCCWSPRRSRSGTALLWRAAERLGIAAMRPRRPRPPDWSRSARGVRFRHPLVRSAVYRAAPPEERRGLTGRWPRRPTRRRSRPPRLAPRARGGRPRRGRGRASSSARPTARRRAAAWRRRPPSCARRRADARSRAAGARALAAAQAKYQAGAPDGAPAARDRRVGPLDELERARARLCAPRSRSPPRAAATRPRCCSPRPGGSSRSTPRLARETYLEALARGDLRRPARRRRRRRTRRGRARRAAPPRRRARSTSSSTASRPASPTATRPARRRSGGADAFGTAPTPTGDDDSAGCGWLPSPGPAPTSGTTRRGTTRRARGRGWRATPARSPPARRAHLPPASTSAPASSAPPRR